MPLLNEDILSVSHPRQRDYYIWDSKVTGFGVRVSYSGRKTFVLKWQDLADKKSIRRKMIGVVGDMPVDKARDLAREILVTLVSTEKKGSQSSRHSKPGSREVKLEPRYQHLVKWLDGSAHFSEQGTLIEPVPVVDQIIGAACEKFLEDGYAVNLNEIAQAAGVTRPTVYKYFDNKEQLFRAAMARMALDIIPDLDLASEPDITAALLKFAKMFRKIILSEKLLAHYRLAITDLAAFPEISDRAFELGRERIIVYLSTFLREQAEKGLIQKFDTMLASEQFLSACIGFERTRRLAGQKLYAGAREEKYLKHIVEFFLAGAGYKRPG